jgi:protein-tyrosine phosphatase
MLWIALDGAVNVRDVGGLPTSDGSVTADKRLLRSDNLQELSEADIALLVGEYGLRRVIDLRSEAEVNSEGPGPMSRVAAVEHVQHSVIPMEGPHTDRAQVVTDVLLARRRERFAGTDPDAVATGHYLGYLEDRPDSVVAALRAIAGTPGAALVHCAAGKDRTGVIVALALLAVGVEREAVIADYTATADRITAILARLRATETYAESLEGSSEELHRPRAVVMTRFLEVLDADHGGVLPWLAGQGFGTEDVEALRLKLLEPAPPAGPLPSASTSS